jgi:hypothetical protein
VIVVTNVNIVNKPINNPNGVFSGVTRTIGDQKWSGTPNIVQYWRRKLEINKENRLDCVLERPWNRDSIQVNAKAIPVTGCGGPQDCEMSRLPHFLNNRLTAVSSALRAGRPLPPRRFLVLISVKGLSRHKTHGQKKVSLQHRTQTGFIRWVRGDLSPAVNRPKCETHHSPPSSAEDKNACLPPVPPPP